MDEKKVIVNVVFCTVEEKILMQGIFDWESHLSSVFDFANLCKKEVIEKSQVSASCPNPDISLLKIDGDSIFKANNSKQINRGQ